MIYDRDERRRSDQGFTLVELSFVVLLVGILALIAIASFRGSSARAAEATCLSNQRTLSTAITTYRSTMGAAPESLDELAPFARDVTKCRFCPLDGAVLEMNTDADQVTCPNHPR